MIQVVKQKSIVSLSFRCNAVIIKTRIDFAHFSILWFAWWSPTLWIRWVAYHSIYMQGMISVLLVILIKIRPVVLQRVAISCNNIVRNDTTHNKIHTSKVIRILLQLLCVILDAVVLLDMACHRLADINKKWARAARWVVDFYLRAVLKMVSHNLWH